MSLIARRPRGRLAEKWLDGCARRYLGRVERVARRLGVEYGRKMWSWLRESCNRLDMSSSLR